MLELNIADIERLNRLVDAAQRIVITCHVAPDGDAMGSSLALCHMLNSMHKRAAVVTPDMPPRTLCFLPGAQDVIVLSRNTEKAKVHVAAADLIFCLDFNTIDRIDLLAPAVESAKAPKVLIDHHLHPDIDAEVVISRPVASSTCYLLYEVMKAAGWADRMNATIAECIYTGMMTDTGNFSFNSCDPQLYTDIAELLRLGIDKDRIYREACNTHSCSELRLNGYAISRKMQILEAHRAALIVLTAEELQEYDYHRGDTEGLVNVPLSIPDVQYSIFLREDEERVKVSMRSKGTFPVNRMCSDHFGGGGHLNAAGGEISLPIGEAVELVLSVLPEYDSYL